MMIIIIKLVKSNTTCSNQIKILKSITNYASEGAYKECELFPKKRKKRGRKINAMQKWNNSKMGNRAHSWQGNKMCRRCIKYVYYSYNFDLLGRRYYLNIWAIRILSSSGTVQFSKGSFYSLAHKLWGGGGMREKYYSVHW